MIKDYTILLFYNRYEMWCIFFVHYYIESYSIGNVMQQLPSIDERHYDFNGHFGVFIDVNWLGASVMTFFDATDDLWIFITILDVFVIFWRFSKFEKKLKIFLTKIDESINVIWLQFSSFDVNYRQYTTSKYILLFYFQL